MSVGRLARDSSPTPRRVGGAVLLVALVAFAAGFSPLGVAIGLASVAVWLFLGAPGALLVAAAGVAGVAAPGSPRALLSFAGVALVVLLAETARWRVPHATRYAVVGWALVVGGALFAFLTAGRTWLSAFVVVGLLGGAAVAIRWFTLPP